MGDAVSTSVEKEEDKNRAAERLRNENIALVDLEQV